jgi:hypothetical protein
VAAAEAAPAPAEAGLPAGTWQSFKPRLPSFDASAYPCERQPVTCPPADLQGTCTSGRACGGVWACPAMVLDGRHAELKRSAPPHISKTIFPQPHAATHAMYWYSLWEVAGSREEGAVEGSADSRQVEHGPFTGVERGRRQVAA